MKKLHIIFNVEELKREILQFKLNKKIIGYVPTLGGLHEGHLKLIRFAKKNSDIVIVSIFLNPIQFNSKKDFQSYPKNILQDKKKISLEKVDILYVPSIKQIFPEKKIKKINASRIAKKLCPYQFEIKAQNRMRTMWKWYKQASKNTRLNPVVIAKSNSRDPLVLIDLDHFFDLIK